MGDKNIYPIKYSDIQAWAKNLDPDETRQNAASDQGLWCFPLIQQLFVDTSTDREIVQY